MNAFDAMNRRTQVTAKVGETEGFTNLYTYDALGRVNGITQDDKWVEYTYNAAGQRTATSVFAGVDKVFDTLYSYDGAGRLTSLTHQNDEKVFVNYDYSWDIANRITAMNDGQYGYDKTSQLISAVYDELPKETYEYDANGNRRNFETGKNNQLLSDGVFSYEYDAEGNRTAKKSKSGEVTQYEWDHRNRLVKVITPQETIKYIYDFQNRLIKINDEFIIHDNWQIVLTCNETGNITNRYLWGANQDELLCDNDGWTLCDHLGTIRNVLDSNGVLRNSFEYDAFGNLVNATNLKSFPRFRYSGKLFDETTELQWNINRWYDAKVGQWVSKDPIGLGVANRNLYEYSSNCPVIVSDPFGLLSNESYVLSCLFSKYPLGCNEKSRIISYLKLGMVLEGMGQMGIDAMLAGITLPASIAGKVTVASLKSVANTLLGMHYAGTEIDYDTIVQELIKVLGGTAEDVSILVPLVQHILSESVGYSGAGTCTTINSTYETTQTSDSAYITINCTFYVCYDTQWTWFGLLYLVTNWTVSGSCSYTCSDGSAQHKCCDKGLKYSGAVSISGTGSGTLSYHTSNPCTVNTTG